MLRSNDERRLPEGERRIDERLAGHAHRPTETRLLTSARADQPYVFADTSIVTARSGRSSQLHIVRCPWEVGVHHLHRAPLSFVSGRRRSPCGRVYVVISNVLGVVRGVA